MLIILRSLDDASYSRQYKHRQVRTLIIRVNDPFCVNLGMQWLLMANGGSDNSQLPKILIAEDNEQTMNLMFRYFSKANERGDIVCELHKAFDGEETIRKIEEELPDLILCDIEMPKKNGFDVLEHFNTVRDTIPYIFFAFCSASQDERIKAFKMGAMGFISKTKIDYYVTTLQIQAWLRLASLERLKSSSLSKS